MAKPTDINLRVIIRARLVPEVRRKHDLDHPSVRAQASRAQQVLALQRAQLQLDDAQRAVRQAHQAILDSYVAGRAG